MKHAVKPRKVDDKKDEELEKKTLGLKANQEEKKLSQQLQIIRVRVSRMCREKILNDRRIEASRTYLRRSNN